MKFALFLLVSVVLTAVSNAELLIFPAAQTNSLSVEAGEVIRMWHKDEPINPPPDNIKFQVVLSGTNVFNRRDAGANPVEIAGPAQISFATNAKHFVLVDKYESTEVATIILRTSITNTINVGSNKTLRLLDWGGQNGSDIRFEIVKGTNNFSLYVGINGNVRDLHELDLPGPFFLKVTKTQGSDVLLSYYIAEDFTSLPPYSVPHAVGNHQIVIERSSDLQQWRPAFMNRSQSGEKAFYRFRFDK